MITYQGAPHGPRDPATPGGYCLTRCLCGTCPQYDEQRRQVALLREQEYQARVRTDTQRAGRKVHAINQQRRTTPGSSIDERFAAFHAKNGHVYDRVVELVADAILAGQKRIGVGALFEQLRYSERTETNGDAFRLNNDFRAPLVRLLIQEHPEWRDLFELRERKTA